MSVMNALYSIVARRELRSARSVKCVCSRRSGKYSVIECPRDAAGVLYLGQLALHLQTAVFSVFRFRVV